MEKFTGIHLRAISDSAQVTIRYDEFEHYTLKISVTWHRGQWVDK